MPPAIGSRLGPYEIVGVIGAGGMGQVYRAIDTRLNRTVALKIVAGDAVADPDRRRRFLNEARAASALNHPNIVTIHDIGDVDGVSFLVMELVAGRPVSALLQDASGAPRGLTIDQVLRMALQIATALDAAHGAGIVHRDIKPANIMAADSESIKLLDFGVSKVLQPIGQDETTAVMTAATEAGHIVGTPAYHPSRCRACRSMRAPTSSRLAR